MTKKQLKDKILLSRNSLVWDYLKAIHGIAEAFTNKYYDYLEWYYIIWNENVGFWPVEIADRFRSIDNMVTSLSNDIPYGVLTTRYDENVNNYEQWKQQTNLYTYYQQWKEENSQQKK